MGRRETAASRAAAAPRVSVRELKDRISKYLNAVEAGQVVTVTSHGRAVADLVPHTGDGSLLRVREATRPWGSVEFRRTGKGRTDSVSLLLAERRRR